MEAYEDFFIGFFLIITSHTIISPMFQYNFITIDGNTGAGKTTLAEMLAKDFQGTLILEEFVENPFLADFYSEPNRYAFQTELYFLVDRYEQLCNTIRQLDLYNQLHIADYVFKKSLLYAKANLKGPEYDLFERIYQMAIKDLPEPELLIYIHSKADRLVANIQKRGRDFEQVVRKSYLQKVEDIYFEYFKDNEHLRILVIPSDELDFVEKREDYERIIEGVTQKYEPGIHYLEL